MRRNSINVSAAAETDKFQSCLCDVETTMQMDTKRGKGLIAHSSKKPFLVFGL